MFKYYLIYSLNSGHLLNSLFVISYTQSVNKKLCKRSQGGGILRVDLTHGDQKSRYYYTCRKKFQPLALLLLTLPSCLVSVPTQLVHY